MLPVICFTLIFNVSKFFELDVITEHSLTLRNGTILYGHDLDNLTLEEGQPLNVTFILTPTKLRIDSMYITIYILWMNLIFNILGPFVILAVLNHMVILNELQALFGFL